MWALILRASRILGRDVVWIFANAFAFLPNSAQVIQPGVRPLFASVRQLGRVLGAFLGAVTLIIILYRVAMQRTGRAPADEVLKFFPPRLLFYVNVGFLVVVFCLVCWLALRVLSAKSDTPVGLSSVLQAFVRALGAVLGLQLLLLIPPQAIVLAYVASKPGAIALMNPVLDGLTAYGVIVLLLSFALVFLSTLALLARAAGSSFVKAGAAVLLAGAATLGIAYLVDPYYQILVALSEQPR